MDFLSPLWSLQAHLLGDEERKLIDAIADKKNYVSEQLFTSGLSLNFFTTRTSFARYSYFYRYDNFKKSRKSWRSAWKTYQMNWNRERLRPRSWDRPSEIRPPVTLHTYVHMFIWKHLFDLPYECALDIHQNVFIKSSKKARGRDGRTLVNNSRVTFHLYLIGQEDGTRFLDKSQSTVLQKWASEVHWIVQDSVLTDI